jgi:hypothetical protein
MNIELDKPILRVVIDRSGTAKVITPSGEEIPFMEKVDVHFRPKVDVNKVTITALAKIEFSND